jgi:hypothetical protein
MVKGKIDEKMYDVNKKIHKKNWLENLRLNIVYRGRGNEISTKPQICLALALKPNQSHP